MSNTFQLQATIRGRPDMKIDLEARWKMPGGKADVQMGLDSVDLTFEVDNPTDHLVDIEKLSATSSDPAKLTLTLVSSFMQIPAKGTAENAVTVEANAKLEPSDAIIVTVAGEGTAAA